MQDIDIAEAATLIPITEIARRIGIEEDEIELYGRYKAKISLDLLRRLERSKEGHLVVVTSTNPTKAGEGKTTVTVGLGQALNRLGVSSSICIREPSLGPCMGVKGGAAGGGYSQVVPMEDINLHFTGDLHAVQAAHNLLAAMVDNHLQQGNALGIDPRTITWPRVLDMNDRSLRHIVLGLGGRADGVPRESAFVITVASEVMAILCLATGIEDLKARLGRIVVGSTYGRTPVCASDLHAAGAMAALLKDAIKPNLVQTLEGSPAFIHGGPFANIAHGTNSILATRMALHLSDVVLVESGFGSDLGFEKFMDIVTRTGGFLPEAVIIVSTIRSLKLHGGQNAGELTTENLGALERGLPNLERHVHNVRQFGFHPIVALNHFPTDTDAEVAMLLEAAKRLKVEVVFTDVWARGGAGGEELAKVLLKELDERVRARPLYPLEMPLRTKVETVAQKVYGAEGVDFTPEALRSLKLFEDLGYGELPVCLAKTQTSFSDDPTKLGSPKGFRVTMRQASLSAGAGFVVCLLGDIMTMPGLPKEPAAEKIDLSADGKIRGLF